MSTNWTAKYAPQNRSQLVGNKAIFDSLYAWITKYSLQKEKIALLAGPPGIGKTSGTYAIAKELNYEIVEFNASDQRNEDVIISLVRRASASKQNTDFNGRIVLLDEVDGLSGNEDRGGVSALLRIAKSSHWPIIATANDPYEQKLRSIRQTCKLLIIKPPTKEDIVHLLERILAHEGIESDKAVLNAIATSCNGDLRAAINDIMNLAEGRKVIPKNAIIALKERDTEIAIFDALKKIFGGAKNVAQAHEVTSDLDVDYSEFINWVQENSFLFANNPTELAEMYDNISKADTYHGRIIYSQEWGLLKYFYFHLSAGVREAKKTPISIGKQMKPYTAFFESFNARKVRNEIAYKIGHTSHASLSKTLTSTLPYILEILSLLPKGQTKKEPSEQYTKALQYIAKMVYHAHLDEADLEFFLGKSSKKVEVIMNAVDEYERDLVKRNVEEYREGKKHLPTLFLDKYSQDSSTDNPSSIAGQNIKSDMIAVALPFAGEPPSDRESNSVPMPIEATTSELSTSAVTGQKRRGKRSSSVKKTHIDIEEDKKTENVEIDQDNTVDIKKEKKSGKKLMDFL